MGNSTSQIDGVYKAAKSNDYRKLQGLIRQLQGLDAQNRSHYIDWKDCEGRTALMIAASKGYHQIVDELLRCGANYEYVSPASKGGSALHEAILHNHKTIVTLLLRAGCLPFVENRKGYTAVDYAHDARNLELIRLFENYGAYWGWVMIKSRKLMGFKWKLRWCSITPRYSYPSQSTCKLQLNCYASQQSQETKFRLSLEGVKAEVKQISGEMHVYLVLPPNQAPPCNLVSKGDARYGVVVFFKAYDNSPQAIDYINALASVINQQYITLSSATATPSELVPRSSSFDAAMEAIVRNESMQSNHQRESSFQVERPSAPEQPQEVQAVTFRGYQPQQTTEEEACVVCLSNPREAGFVHNDTVHKCVCRECVTFFQVGDACPVCRQPIEVILRKFYE